MAGPSTIYEFHELPVGVARIGRFQVEHPSVLVARRVFRFTTMKRSYMLPAL